jgi:hypothetical protein
MHGDVRRGLDSQTNLVASDVDHGNDDVVADHDAFVAMTGQNEHDLHSLPGFEMVWQSVRWQAAHIRLQLDGDPDRVRSNQGHPWFRPDGKLFRLRRV